MQNPIFWKTKLPFDEHYRNLLNASNFYEQYRMPFIHKGDKCNIISSFGNRKGSAAESELFEYLNTLYSMLVNDFFERLCLKEHVRYTYYYWWQLYEPDTDGSKHPRHSHWANDGTSWSFVHFIQTNNEYCFRFTGPYDEHDILVKETDDDVIFFHPMLLHEALQPTNGNRIVVAGNIRIDDHDLERY